MSQARSRLLLPVSAAKKVIDRIAPARPHSVYKASAEDIMMAAARMRRDGMSREAIRRDLDVGDWVSNKVMDTFLDRAEEYLNKMIAAGMEPAESVTTVEDALQKEGIVLVRDPGLGHAMHARVAELPDDEPIE